MREFNSSNEGRQPMISSREYNGFRAGREYLMCRRWPRRRLPIRHHRHFTGEDDGILAKTHPALLYV